MKLNTGESLYFHIPRHLLYDESITLLHYGGIVFGIQALRRNVMSVTSDNKLPIHVSDFIASHDET